MHKDKFEIMVEMMRDHSMMRERKQRRKRRYWKKKIRKVK